jgi:hypothetical protein
LDRPDCPVRPEAPPAAIVADAHTAFRAEFLELVGRIGLAPDKAVLLVEARSGHPFETCTPAELVPFLRDLLTLAHPITYASGAPACHA